MAKLVHRHKGRQPVIVTSALPRVTDLLLDAAPEAIAGIKTAGNVSGDTIIVRGVLAVAFGVPALAQQVAPGQATIVAAAAASACSTQRGASWGVFRIDRCNPAKDAAPTATGPSPGFFTRCHPVAGNCPPSIQLPAGNSAARKNCCGVLRCRQSSPWIQPR